MQSGKPLILSAPHPRSIDLIFSELAQHKLRETYCIVEAEPDSLADVPASTLAEVRYVLGQPPISTDTLNKMSSLRAVLNVESNLFDNMPYPILFQRGIHVLTTGAVFAEPVAEMGIAMALNLARDIIEADVAFSQGREQWGMEGNHAARLLSGADVGIIGFGDLGKALNRLLSGFHPTVRGFDPWLPPSVLREHQVIPTGLDATLAQSDFVFVLASVTSQNQGFLAAPEFARMRPGAALILLSRAATVDFDALMQAVASGHILAASDVFPDEPLAQDHPVRQLKGFVRSAHRAGALEVAFKRMGDMVLEDMALMDSGLPPLRCKRAERETVALMRSKPVDEN